MSSKFTIQRNTSLVLEYENNFYVLDAVGSYSYSQTYTRNSTARKTIHNKTPKPLTVLTGKSAGTADLQVPASSNFIEAVLFELIGLDLETSTYDLPFNLKVEPRYFNLYIVGEYSTTKLTKCALTSLDINMSKQAAISFSVNLEFSNLETNILTPVTGTYQGSMLETPLTLSITMVDAITGETTFGNLQSFNFSVQQSFSWREDNNIQTIGELYLPTRAVITDMPVNSVISLYANHDQILPEIIYNAKLVVTFGNIRITITNALLTKRYEVQEVLSLQYDITLQENSSVEVEYGAII